MRDNNLVLSPNDKKSLHQVISAFFLQCDPFKVRMQLINGHEGIENIEWDLIEELQDAGFDRNPEDEAM